MMIFPWRPLVRMRIRYSTEKLIGSHRLSSAQQYPVESSRGEVEKARLQDAENRRWAKEPGANKLLAQPPFVEKANGSRLHTTDILKSLDNYLEAREWHRVSEGPARRFISHLLTYPLTLATGIQQAGFLTAGSALNGGVSSARSSSPSSESSLNAVKHPASSTPPEKAASTAGSGRRLNVVCIGARAESTLPPAFWRETLFALQDDVSHLKLHLIGPEVTVPSGILPATRAHLPDRPVAGGDDRSRASAEHKSSADNGGDDGSKESCGGVGRSISPTSALVRVGNGTAEISWTRAVLGNTAGDCVPVGADGKRREPKEKIGDGSIMDPVAESAVERADLFVLFNPGLGHPHLLKGWEGAMKRLLISGKPIVISCHSRKDLDRDTERIHALGERCCPGWAEGRGKQVFPTGAVFRSLMTAEDPLSRPGAEEIVSNNWGMIVVPGASSNVLEQGC